MLKKQKMFSSGVSIFLLETYVLTIFYSRQMYRDTRIIETLLAFYIGFPLLLAFSFFRLGNGAADIDSRIGALILIRLSITINTMPTFVTVFERPRMEEIGGLGKNGIAFNPTSVYVSKWLSLCGLRIILFIPFTAIVYPIVQQHDIMQKFQGY